MHIFEERYEVRLAANADEIKESQQLRYKVFIEEMGGSVTVHPEGLQLERDEFDDYCYHLLLIDRKNKSEGSNGKIAAVTRLMPGSDAESGIGFCSAKEYDLGPLMRSRKKCLELGRTCIDKAYRNGLTLHYLWKGLGSFVSERDIDLLFGLASFPGNDVRKISMGLSFIYNRYLAPQEIRPKALKHGLIDMNLVPETEFDKIKALGQIPSLLKGYMRLGARSGEGAFMDRSLNTIDICIVIDVRQMTEKYRDYYGKAG